MKSLLTLVLAFAVAGCATKSEVVETPKLSSNTIYHPAYEYHGVKVAESSNWFLGHGAGLSRDKKLYFQHVSRQESIVDFVGVTTSGAATSAPQVISSAGKGSVGLMSSSGTRGACVVPNADSSVQGERHTFKVHFKTNRTEPYDFGVISQEIAKLNPSKVVITGHTDDIGNDEYNYNLSVKRAARVMELLKDMPGWGDVLFDVSGGGSCPRLVLNKDDDTRQMNRRAEITVYGGAL